MTRIRFTLAQVKTFPNERPDACKRCGSPILTPRGTAEKSATDLRVDRVTVVRRRRSDFWDGYSSPSLTPPRPRFTLQFRSTHKTDSRRFPNAQRE